MEAGQTTMSNLIDMKAVAEMISVKPKSIYYIMKSDETFPQPITLSPRIKRWKLEDIQSWIEEKTK